MHNKRVQYAHHHLRLHRPTKEDPSIDLTEYTFIHYVTAVALRRKRRQYKVIVARHQLLLDGYHQEFINVILSVESTLFALSGFVKYCDL